MWAKSSKVDWDDLSADMVVVWWWCGGVVHTPPGNPNINFLHPMYIPVLNDNNHSVRDCHLCD